MRFGWGFWGLAVNDIMFCFPSLRLVSVLLLVRFEGWRLFHAVKIGIAVLV